MDSLARRVAERQLSVRETEELVRRATEVASAEFRVAGEEKTQNSELGTRNSLEEELQRALGTKVQIVQSRRGGRLIIHYYDDDQLTGLLDTLLQREES